MQLILPASTLLALVASALALQVTSPAQDSSLDLSKDNTITWVSVSSDPTTFNIVLVDQTVNPPVSMSIASNVQTSAGSYSLSALTGVTPGTGYQFNLVGSSANNNGILAQSAQFTVTSAGSSTTLASFSSSTPSTSLVSSTSTLTSTLTSSDTTLTTTTTSTSTSATVESTSSSSTSTSGTSSSSSSASKTSSAGTSSGSTSASKSSSASANTASPSSTGAASTLTTFAGAGVFAMLAALFI